MYIYGTMKREIEKDFIISLYYLLQKYLTGMIGTFFNNMYNLVR